ncbi:DNA polymerase III subunit delta [Fructilactobacillus fructivorans]|uniref:DNA polymerase III subunit delta' n=1 Tax=Fructilactobacillus fructivorans TaxID=1614 RepID=UPI0007052D47|nr:DNA polymerase III subunit delta' [Fructilactobacillus fructivorans]KRN12742.1 DNA polymerase III subunit delta [Fructilactobacillus fructivorans]
MVEENPAQSVINEAKRKQPSLTKHFMGVVTANDLSHSYLFSGVDGLGKLAVAKTIAMRLFCKNVRDGMPCGVCNECIRIAKDEHPDIVMVKPDGRSIKVDSIRYLKREFYKSAVEGNQKVFIIDDADTMTTSAANSLLKFIEEPNGQVNSFLLTDDYRKILPTIISRTQLIEFPKINEDDLIKYVTKKRLSKTSSQLILELTGDLVSLDKMLEDGWFNKMKATVERWFNELVEDDYRAFTNVQTNFMPLVTGRFEQQMTLKMIYQIFKDVFDVKFKDSRPDSLGFGDQYTALKKMALKLSDEQLITIITSILGSTRKQDINVSFQNILEVITLNCLAVIEG